jgi:serine/threonine protein kinase
VVTRFEAERQALAMMEHPRIAKVLDAGSTDAGRPVFVVELARGEAITRCCDARCLDARQRLDLFVRVCHAVQHAHTKGLIHRDLKPANIQVSEVDGRQLPRIDEAEACLAEALDKARRGLTDDHPPVGDALNVDARPRAANHRGAGRARIDAHPGSLSAVSAHNRPHALAGCWVRRGGEICDSGTKCRGADSNRQLGNGDSGEGAAGE